MPRQIKKEINQTLIGLCGVPKKYRNNPAKYPGYYKLIQKWINELNKSWDRDGYPADHIYQVVSKMRDGALSRDEPITIGLVYWRIKNDLDDYTPTPPSDEEDDDIGEAGEVNEEDIKKVKEMFGGMQF